MNFAPILPELILTLGGLILMMVAAIGRRTASLTTWASIAVLIAACFALLGEPQHAGPQFGGLIVADDFGADAVGTTLQINVDHAAPAPPAVKQALAVKAAAAVRKVRK